MIQFAEDHPIVTAIVLIVVLYLMFKVPPSNHDDYYDLYS